MKIFLAIVLVTVLVTLYVVLIRPWLRKRPWAQPFFDKIEPIERVLYWNSETILFARFTMVLGGLMTVLTQMGQWDITPLMPLVPDEYEPALKVAWNLLPLTVTVLGWVIEQLRKDTTKPLEIVGMRTDAPPEVKKAAAQAATANTKAAEMAEASGSV